VRIVAGADHAGFELKDVLVKYMRELGHQVEDLGTHGTLSVDYPDYGHWVASKVASGEAEAGLLVCGTGVGMAISANRHRGIRAVNPSDVFTARMSRSHNDSNVLCLGARVVGTGLATEILATWLSTPFEGGRHAQRVAKIEPL
jgi:ribose 5-phosphate isomerase B